MTTHDYDTVALGGAGPVRISRFGVAYHAPAGIFGTAGANRMDDTPRTMRSAFFGADGASEPCHQSFFEHWKAPTAWRCRMSSTASKRGGNPA